MFLIRGNSSRWNQGPVAAVRGVATDRLHKKDTPENRSTWQLLGGRVHQACTYLVSGSLGDICAVDIYR
jgi:hypothetical protein